MSTLHSARPLDVVVIGGGQSGLAIAWHLKQQQRRFVVLDAGPEVGHVWRSRWQSLRLFTPAQYDALPGTPFPAAADTYPTKDEVADYLRDYAGQHDLPVRCNSAVQRLERVGQVFVITTSGGEWLARQVVVATGGFQRAFVPDHAAQLHPSVVQTHSSAYSSPADLPAGRVLVVGGGNSGLQIAAELTRTHEVHLALGSATQRVPQRLLGKDLFWWFTKAGLMRKPADSRLARRVRARGEMTVGTSASEVQQLGATTHGRVEATSGRQVSFAAGTTIEVDAVVWATGYRSSYHWVDVPGFVVDGKVAQTRGVTDVPGLYVLGLPWQHTRGSSLLGFVKHDAEYVAERVQQRAVRRSPLQRWQGTQVASLDRRVPAADRQLARAHATTARSMPHHLVSLAPLNPAPRA
jgi:putative flavoprotein involved in K+ transport